MSTRAITQREAGRLARSYTARVMAEQLGKMTTLDLLLDGHRGRRGELTLYELRNLLEAFNEEIEKLERRAGEDVSWKPSPVCPVKTLVDIRS